mmetsp:Transcript_53293/g.125138  ORF Transcript_53293/g.125138 Transcript_53293/m.125138 type:complete len:311 (-) Transcript_53293:3673-4605(-)
MPREGDGGLAQLGERVVHAVVPKDGRSRHHTRPGIPAALNDSQPDACCRRRIRRDVDALDAAFVAGTEVVDSGGCRAGLLKGGQHGGLVEVKGRTEFFLRRERLGSQRCHDDLERRRRRGVGVQRIGHGNAPWVENAESTPAGMNSRRERRHDGRHQVLRSGRWPALSDGHDVAQVGPGREVDGADHRHEGVGEGQRGAGLAVLVDLGDLFSVLLLERVALDQQRAARRRHDRTGDLAGRKSQRQVPVAHVAQRPARAAIGLAEVHLERGPQRGVGQPGHLGVELPGVQPHGVEAMLGVRRQVGHAVVHA